MSYDDYLPNRNTFDGREVLDQISALRDADPEDQDELDNLLAFAEEAERVAGDWPNATFIRDSYWVQYAQELADELGAVDYNAGWPAAYIDWDRAASDLKMDYSSIDLDGIEFWVRS